MFTVQLPAHLVPNRCPVAALGKDPIVLPFQTLQTLILIPLDLGPDRVHPPRKGEDTYSIGLVCNLLFSPNGDILFRYCGHHSKRSSSSSSRCSSMSQSPPRRRRHSYSSSLSGSWSRSRSRSASPELTAQQSRRFYRYATRSHAHLAACHHLL